MSILTRPFFILGNPRSGTSLLRIILNAHPNIVVPPESGFMQWWYSKYSDWTTSDNSTKLESFLADLLSSKKIEGFKLDELDLKKYVLKANPGSYAELIATVYVFYARKKQLLAWGDKNNYYIHHIPILKSLYPNAKFIHLVRDGRDVACSYWELEKSIEKNTKYRPDLPQDIKSIAIEWKDNNLKIENEIDKTENIRVRFEEIIAKFDEEMQRILTFLNVPWNEDIRNYSIKNDEPLETLSWKKKTQLPPQKSVIHRHKRDLTLSEITSFNNEASTLLRKYGYSV